MDGNPHPSNLFCFSVKNEAGGKESLFHSKISFKVENFTTSWRNGLAFNALINAHRYKEKGELEALFFTIQTKRKAMGRKPYAPPQGLFMYDVESAWEKLNRAENDRQVAIIAELQRQERIEQLAQRFHKKANLRESWLRNVQREEMDHGRTATEVEKSLKKQQAIANDIIARMEVRLAPDVNSGSFDKAKAERFAAMTAANVKQEGPIVAASKFDEVYEGRAYIKDDFVQFAVGCFRGDTFYISPIAGTFDMHRSLAHLNNITKGGRDEEGRRRKQDSTEEEDEEEDEGDEDTAEGETETDNPDELLMLSA